MNFCSVKPKSPSNIFWAVLTIFILPLTVAAQTSQQTLHPLEVGYRESLIILAPHPDDETLSAGGLVQEVLAKGGYVRSVVVTSGDAYVDAIQDATGKRHLTRTDFLHYGEQRLNESRDVAHFLGKGYIHLDLFGYSDGSIYSMLVNHWQRNRPDKSEFTGFNHVPYREAEDRGIAQDGEDLLNELIAIFKDSKPTMIVFPDVMEDDSDHAGLGMFSLLAINDWLVNAKDQTLEPRLLAYLIHWQHWPIGADADKPIDYSNQALYLPDNLPLRGHARTCLDLTKSEVDIKRQALWLYKTQVRAMSPFLQAFVHSNECFTQLKVKDTKGIENVVKQWQHVRKAFNSHPITRRKIL